MRSIDPESEHVTKQPRGHAREILALALPAFATLVAEPLMLMADSAIVGHLGTNELAGLGIAGNVMGIINGLCVFLAYGTTATVARRLGAGDKAAALAGGIDGMVLAVLLGVVLAATGTTFHTPIVGLYGADPGVSEQAGRYFAISALGLPALLTMLASTGVLRGLQDTRTPLYVAIGVNISNVILSLTLVYGVGLGIAGAALGTVISQYAAAGVLGGMVLRGARREGTRIKLEPAGALRAARSGVWLLLRNLSLQISVTATTLVATHIGTAGLAAHQVANSIWSFLVMALDAIAIAAQAIIGRYLGAADAEGTRAVTAQMVRWGAVWGGVLTLLLIGVRGLLAPLFTPDVAVQQQLIAALFVMALLQPIAGIVFVLDGVLIGAGDARYLAFAGLVATVAYLPFAIWVDRLNSGLVWLWAAYGVYMTARLLTLGYRARTDSWMKLGA